jgi:hypothetical protein
MMDSGKTPVSYLGCDLFADEDARVIAHGSSRT